MIRRKQEPAFLSVPGFFSSTLSPTDRTLRPGSLLKFLRIFTIYLGIPFAISGHSPTTIRPGRFAMQDVSMLFFTVIFFGLAFLYVAACQKLR